MSPREPALPSPFAEATTPGTDDFSGHNTRRMGALVARSAAAREMVMNPLVLATAGAVLGHATSFQLHLTQMIAIGAGEPAQPIHRDQWAFDFFPFPRGHEVQCNTIWALTDFTEENGPELADRGFSSSERTSPEPGV